MFTRQRPKRVFDLYGNEIKVLGHLQSKQHVFISNGEDYRPAFGKILSEKSFYTRLFFNLF